MNKTGYRGIKRNKAFWEVYLTIEGKNTYLGCFKNIKDAIFCHNAAEKIHYPKRKAQSYNSDIVNFSGNIGGL